MKTAEFLKDLNRDITVQGQTLLVEFFITFSRFECALKASGFANGDEDRVSANWDTFLAAISNDFQPDRTAQLKSAVDYLINDPPRIQILYKGKLSWRNRVFQKKDPIINKVGLSIRDIRNNLFHGGKFNGNYEEDVSRNYILLKKSIIILDEWLSLNETVGGHFSAPIS